MRIFSFIRKYFQQKETPNYNEINAKSAMSLCAVPNKKVLVIGCNTGYDCSFFAHAGAAEVHGVDVVDAIGKDFVRNNVFYHKSTAENMPFFNDNTFDLVYSFATMEHIPNIHDTFHEMARVVKYGGFVFSLAAPLWNSRYGHHKPDLFQEYPWIHLILPSEEIKKWFIENHKNHPELKNIDHHVDYMLNKTFFNMKNQKEYIDICENLGLKIVVNTTDKEPESVLTPEAQKILVPKLGTDELLSVTHRFIAQKI